MSDAAEHFSSGGPEGPDDDAWAAACAEDLAAERARRRAESGQGPDAAEEFRRFADALAEKVAELGKPFGATLAGGAAQGVAQQLIGQARSVVEPVVEKNPEVFGHLAAAGGELLAAFRAVVEGTDATDGRKGSGAPGPEHGPGPDTAPGSGPDTRPGSGPDTGGGERS